MLKSNPYLKQLPSTTTKPKPKPKSKTAAPPTAQAVENGNGNDAKAALRAEVLALGGDEEELNMLLEVESESEVEGEPIVQVKGKGKGKGKGKEEKGVDATLEKDLKALLKGLDFKSNGAQTVVPDEEVDEEDDEEDSEEDDDESEEDEEDSDDSDSEEEEEVVAPLPKPEPVTKKESKVEREEKRRIEREAEKLREKVEKEFIREQKSVVKLPVLKSPWVRLTSLAPSHPFLYSILNPLLNSIQNQIIDPTPQWYSVPLRSFTPTSTPPTSTSITSLHTYATTLLHSENSLYTSSLSPPPTSRSSSSAPPPPNGLSKSDQIFIQQILSSGTSSDKISALLLLTSNSPLHCLSYLEQLSNLCKKRSREESGRAIRGVVDWWRGEGGCPGRKLKAFGDQVGVAGAVREWEEGLGKRGGKGGDEEREKELKVCLVVWAFEDWLKKWFFEVLKSLEQMSLDPLAHPRTHAVMHLSNLLRDKPEQEANILRLLVNKLGDSQRGIASKTSHHLLQILQFHPGMTPIMVREISSLVLRPTTATSLPSTSTTHVRFDKEQSKAKTPPKDHGQDHARYYGIITLNQVMLNKSQNEVAGRMIEVYFEIFGDLLGRVKEKEDEEEGEREGEGEGKKRKNGGKRKRGEGDEKDKDKDKEKGEGEVDEMDSKLVAAVLTGVNRAFPFAKIDDEAFKTRLDTLFRITHTGTFNVSIQALMLIYHVSAAKRAVSDRFYRALYASLFDPRLAGSSKQALYLNLVFKAVKQDPNTQRVMAFVKRLVQVMLGMDVTFILGSIWIVGELMATVAGLRKMLTEAEKPAEVATEGDARDASYDGRKREPQFAGAQNSCLWEIVPLLNHFHPSVALHAEQLLKGQPISASTDLEQHSLNHFLDRFVYREAKKIASTKGSSMMQSGVSGQDRTGRIVMKKGAPRGEDTVVNSDKFKNQNPDHVPVDQLFFHKYFSAKTAQGDDKAKAGKKRKSKKGQDDSSDEESIGDLGFSDMEEDAAVPDMEDEEDDSDAAEEEIWKAMKSSMPKETGNDDLGDDLDDSDSDDVAEFDYSDSEEEGEEAADDRPYKSAFDEEDDSEDDGGGLLEDDADLIGSDEDMPLIGEGTEDAKTNDKRKKRKVKHLSTFASADDYAHLLGDSDDDGDDE